MSQQLISRNTDLQRLRNDGFDIQVKGVYLVMRGVPYVNSRRELVRGTLVSELSLAGDVTIKPATHVIYFAGEYRVTQTVRKSERSGLGARSRSSIAILSFSICFPASRTAATKIITKRW
jgi:hypothetical protein